MLHQNSYCSKFRPFLSLVFLLSFSSCGVNLSDFNFSSKPGKKTLAPAELGNSKTYEAKKLSDGPETSLSPEAKVQKGVTPLLLSEELSFSPHTGAITGIIPYGDDSVISGGNDGQVILSRLTPDRTKFVTEKLLVGTKPILAMSLSDDKNLLAISQTSLVSVYDLKERKIVYELSRVRGRIIALSWDPRSELVSIGLAGGDIYIWSLKQSFFGGQGRDSFDSLEHYIGASTPIIGLHFLPSGGAFLSVELEGGLNVWRALRTEEELGLRDKFNLEDQEAISSVMVNFAVLPTFATDSALTSDGNYFLASSADGKLNSWKIRGLVRQVESTVSKESLLSITEVGFGDKKLRSYQFLLTSTQDQKIQILCQKRSSNQSSTALEYLLLAETPPMSSTLSRVRSALSGNLVWASEKSDKIIAISGAELSEQLRVNPRLENCSSN